MIPVRRLLLFLGLSASGCAARPEPAPQPIRVEACPSDTTLVTSGGERVCVESAPVSRGAYRECAKANVGCERPPFRRYLAWGADHADLPMPKLSEASARAYCAYSGRRLASPAEWKEEAPDLFRCVAAPGSPARARTWPPAIPRTGSVRGLNRSDALTWWVRERLFAAPLLDDAGKVTCARIRVERAADGGRFLVWPAVGAEPEKHYPFDLSSGTLRFTDAQTGAVEDWLVGDQEHAGGAYFVGGAPWIPGELECENDAPPVRPLARPFSRGGLTERELLDPEARRRSIVHEDRVMFVPEPERPGQGATGAKRRCARAGFDLDLAGYPRGSAALRIEAEAGDSFYLISEYSRQRRAFVAAADDASGDSGLLPTGLLSLRRDEAGWHLGDATLHEDERACEAAAAHLPYPELDPVFRRRIFAAWIELVRGRDATYVVDTSGAACKRVEMASPDGFPLVGTWLFSGGTGGEKTGFHVTVDGDGVWLRLDPSSGGGGASCVEHRELRGLALSDGVRLGDSTVFGSLAACESERAHTKPFVLGCPAASAAAGSVPAPAAAGPGPAPATGGPRPAPGSAGPGPGPGAVGPGRASAGTQAPAGTPTR